MLARELARQAVDVAHPLHGDQERLLVVEAGLVQVGDLVAQMALELVDVAAVDAGRARDVGAPLRDLLLYVTPPPPPAARRRSARE